MKNIRTDMKRKISFKMSKNFKQKSIKDNHGMDNFISIVERFGRQIRLWKMKQIQYSNKHGNLQHEDFNILLYLDQGPAIVKSDVT